MISHAEALVKHDDPRLDELHAAARVFLAVAERQRSDRNDDPDSMRAESVHWALTAVLNEGQLGEDLALSVAAAFLGCVVSGFDDPVATLADAKERVMNYFAEAMRRRSFAAAPAEGRA